VSGSARAGEGAALSVAVSRDGRMVAAAAAHEACVRLWHLDSPETLRTARKLSGHAQRVCAVAFSPSRSVLATGSLDDSSILWDADSGKILGRLRGHANSVLDVAFSPDGALLATASADKSVRLWAAADAAASAKVTPRVLRAHEDWVLCVAFSPSGALVASGSRDNSVILWRVTSGTAVRALQGHSGFVRAVSFSVDGELLASASEDTQVHVWNVDSGTRFFSVPTHSDHVLTARFLTQGTTLVTGSIDGSLRFTDVVSRIETRELFDCGVHALEVTPDAGALVVGCADGSLRILRVRSSWSVRADVLSGREYAYDQVSDTSRWLWTEHVDAASGRAYRHNFLTGESSWLEHERSGAALQDSLVQASRVRTFDKVFGNSLFGVPVVSAELDGMPICAAICTVHGAEEQTLHDEQFARLRQVTHSGLVNVLGRARRTRLDGVSEMLLLQELPVLGDLQSYIRSQNASRISQSTRLRWTVGIAQALAFVQSIELPRTSLADLHPSGVFVRAHDSLVLVDIGLRSIGKRSDDARRHRCKTWVHYAAPELLRDDVALLPEKVEIYAFGQLCYFIWSHGVDPYDGVAERVIEEDVGCLGRLPDMSLVSAAPPHVVSTMLACLEFLPSLRPSMRQILSSLTSSS